MSELPQLQVLERLLQVLCGVLEERPQPHPHLLRARLHHRPVKSEGERDKRLKANEGIRKGRAIINHWIPLWYAKDSTVYPQWDTVTYAITSLSQSVKVLVMKYET